MESLKACKAIGRPQKQQNTIKPRQNDKNRLRRNATRPHGLDRTLIIIIIIFLAHQHKVIINSVNLLPCWRSFHRRHQVYMIRAYIEH